MSRDEARQLNRMATLMDGLTYQATMAARGSSSM